MSLATRCPACQTVFRVVQDQLRVSEGWVRCGRCNEVFNAAEQMVDLVRPALSDARPPEDVALAMRAEAAAAQAADAEHDETEPAPEEIESGIDTVAEAPAGEQEQRIEPSWAAGAPATSGDDAPVTEPAITLPTFVQAADRAARWQRPAVRRSLLAVAALAAAMLALQLAVEYRDLVAARWTATRPALETLCRWSGCRIEPPRWIEALVVDSSGLVRVEGTSTYRFSVALQNRSEMALALPSIDLTLTDAQGRVIARRAFLAGELGSPANTVAAGTELPLQATLSITERPVAGYTIEIFYP